MGRFQRSSVPAGHETEHSADDVMIVVSKTLDDYAPVQVTGWGLTLSNQ
jgi:hypothetical protein